MRRFGKFSGNRPPVEFGQRLQVHITFAADIHELDPPPFSPSPERGVGNAFISANGLRSPQSRSGDWLPIIVESSWQCWHRVAPLFAFDCLDIAQSVPQQAATKAHRLQIFSAGDCVRAAIPSLRELSAGEKANEDLLAEVGKASLRPDCGGGSARASRPVLIRCFFAHVIHRPNSGTMNYYMGKIGLSLAVSIRARER
jgi:hypothetical protein